MSQKLWIVDFTHQRASHISKTNFVTCLAFAICSLHNVVNVRHISQKPRHMWVAYLKNQFHRMSGFWCSHCSQCATYISKTNFAMLSCIVLKVRCISELRHTIDVNVRSISQKPRHMWVVYLKNQFHCPAMCSTYLKNHELRRLGS